MEPTDGTKKPSNAAGAPASWDRVIEQMKSRDRLGVERYGVRLRPHNGRDSLRDVQEELLDGAVYIENAIAERDKLLADARTMAAALRAVFDALLTEDLPTIIVAIKDAGQSAGAAVTDNLPHAV
jgi:hypothetical protein